MARLAQIEIVLRPFEVTERTLISLGRATDEVAREAALQAYNIDVKVDVVLREGSLFIKITVIGSLLLGTYHAIAVYPDFKEGIVQLSEDAHKFGHYMKDHLFKATAVPKEKVHKIKVSDQTPGKVKSLITRLEILADLSSDIPPQDVALQLDAARRDLAKMKDIAPEERQVVMRSLQIEKLPPFEEWSQHYIEAPAQQVDRLREIGGPRKSRVIVREKKKRLRYHNSFTVEHGR